MRQLRKTASEPLRVTSAAAEIDSTLLSKFERGERVPTESQGRALAKHFKVPIKEFESRRLAAKILTEYGSNPVLPEAIARIQAAAI